MIGVGEKKKKTRRNVCYTYILAVVVAVVGS